METQIREVDGAENSSKRPKMLRLRRHVLPVFESVVSKGEIVGRECDVTFHCNGGQVQAHKIILSMVSTYFSDIFKDQKPHKPSIVIIPEINAETMNVILALCYHRNVAINVENMAEVTTWLTALGLGLDKFTFQLSSESRKIMADTSITLAKQPDRASKIQAEATIAPHTPQPAVEDYDIELGRSAGLSGPDDAHSALTRTNQGPTYWLDSTVCLNQKQTSKEWNLNSNEKIFDDIKLLQKHTSGSATMSGVRVEQGSNHEPGVVRKGNDLNTQGTSSQQRAGDSENWGCIADRGKDEIPTNMHTKNQDTTGRKEEPASSFSAFYGIQSAPSKRLAAGCSPSLPRILKAGSAKVSKMQCTVCDVTFEENTKWLWHIARHQANGLFKCTFCKLRFIDTKGVFRHEKVYHNVVGIPDDFTGQDVVHKQQQLPQNVVPIIKLSKIPSFNGSQGRAKLQEFRHVNQSVSGTGCSTSTAISSLPAFKVPKQPIFKTGTGPVQRTNAKRIYKVKSKVSLDGQDKVRWLYACLTCNHSSDSSVKAYVHHVACNGSSGQNYEETVVKYRQGHYGNFKCPLCPRRYITLYGFVVHSIHNHAEYKKRLSHVISEDKLICVNCGQKFNGPEDFHAHLNSNHRCGRPTKQSKATRYYRKYASQWCPTNDESPNLQVARATESESRSLDSSGHTEEAESLIVESEQRQQFGSGSKFKSNIGRIKLSSSNQQRNITHSVGSGKRPYRKAFKSSPTASFEHFRDEHVIKMLGTNPKSARLQSRLAAVTAVTEALTENQVCPFDENAEDVTEIDCPVCGSTVKNLSTHLITDHVELSATIESMSESIFRCKVCSVSFASCDLLAHLKSCSFIEQLEAEYGKSLEPISEMKNSPKRVRRVLEIPDSVGKSSLNSMDNKDLSSIESLRSALTCGVCKRVSKRLNIISECLKTHGIYRCSLCFNTYTTNEHRLLHLKSCHRDAIGHVKCPICSAVRANIGQVSSHMYLTHWASFYGRQGSGRDSRLLLPTQELPLQILTGEHPSENSANGHLDELDCASENASLELESMEDIGTTVPSECKETGLGNEGEISSTDGKGNTSVETELRSLAESGCDDEKTGSTTSITSQDSIPVNGQL